MCLCVSFWPSSDMIEACMWNSFVLLLGWTVSVPQLSVVYKRDGLEAVIGNVYLTDSRVSHRSLRKDRVSCACVDAMCVSVACPQVHLCLFMYACMTVWLHLQQAVNSHLSPDTNNCFSCCLRALALSIKPVPQVPSSPTTMSLSYSTPLPPEPKHFAPVSSCAGYLVKAEIRTQLTVVFCEFTPPKTSDCGSAFTSLLYVQFSY